MFALSWYTSKDIPDLIRFGELVILFWVLFFFYLVAESFLKGFFPGLINK